MNGNAMKFMCACTLMKYKSAIGAAAAAACTCSSRQCIPLDTLRCVLYVYVHLAIVQLKLWFYFGFEFRFAIRSKIEFVNTNFNDSTHFAPHFCKRVSALYQQGI